MNSNKNNVEKLLSYLYTIEIIMIIEIDFIIFVSIDCIDKKYFSI